MNVIVLGKDDSVRREIGDHFKGLGHEITLCEKRTRIPENRYDLAVDISARGMRDIQRIVNALKGKISHYVLVSSCRVYPSVSRLNPWQPDEVDLCDETGFETVEKSVRELRAAERELRILSPKSMPWTILRPAVIEFKNNPESQNMWWFISRILDGDPIILPDNDDPLFRHISVSDLVSAICAMANRDETFSQTLNVTSPALLTYESYARLIMKSLGREVPVVRASGIHWASAGISLPMGKHLQSSFIDNSRLLARLGWQATDEIEWVADYAHSLVDHPLQKPIARERELALLEPLPEVERSTLDTVPGWRLVGESGNPSSFRVEAEPGENDNPLPFLKTVQITMGNAEEHFLLNNSDEGVSRILGHNALLKLVEPGESGLLPGSLYLPISQRPCGVSGCLFCSSSEPGLFGVDDDGFCAQFVSLPPEHLLPIPPELQDLALLVDPLACLLPILPSLLKESAGPVWIYGHSVDAILANFLVQDAQRAVVHIDRTSATRKFLPQEITFMTLSGARRRVKSGELDRPSIIINLSGSHDGENLLVPSLAKGGTLITPFSKTGAHRRTQRLELPLAAPGRYWLEKSIEQISSWSGERDLNGLVYTVPFESQWDVFRHGYFKLTCIEVSGGTT